MAYSPIATAADYADAMLTARRAKNVLVVILLAFLVFQLAIFLATRFSTSFRGIVTAAPVAWAAASTQPTGAGEVNTRALSGQLLHYLTALINLFGIAAVLVLAIDLLLIIQIMLVGRLVGVATVTVAFLWCVALAVLLFPWLAISGSPDLVTANFRLPGVFYTWGELVAEANFRTGGDVAMMILKWTRWVGAPIAAIVILLIVHLKSRLGLRQALGEATLEDELPLSEPTNPPQE